MRYGCQILTNIHQQSLYSMNLEYYLLMNLLIHKTVVYFKMSSIMKYPKPYKIFSKILVINPITKPERYTIRNLIYPRLEPLIMDSSQKNTNLPKLGTKHKLILVTNLTLVIGQRLSSQNHLKSITSVMVARCLT